MRKIIVTIFALMGFAILFSACGGETYADKLKKESKAINRFIDDNGIKVLYTYPDKHQFAENEYYLEPSTGIYVHVIDSGIKDKPSKENKTQIFLRYDAIYDMLENTDVSGSNFSGVAMSFEYGTSSTYYSTDYSTTYTAQMYYFLSQACVIPLELGLGKYAEVKLIVPFASGSTYQQSSYVPLYYSRLQYNFLLDQPEE
ncbi:hypothetical protein GGR21_000928 [Dysgonomonas hofstadii]|uniref:DUF4827 domain-containing protein n=1 Tax=Dysgonomonas hofstadii TaxID=637886 RepID=A0A840CK46_9BACT|nr:DUF4827 family protein [Dysgonomonas hofstadii]MBB4035039.1 hypothetical protein [Dysgonomonas hofstadii]